MDRRYRLDAEIGAGPTGVVYRATHVVLDKPVVVKVVGHVATALRGRVVAEARLASKIDHPNVAQLSDSGELDDGAFFVMELVQGEPLSSLLARERTIAPARTLAIATQIVDGLVAAHAVGLVHHDLRPEHVLVTATPGDGGESVKLLGFGVARVDASADASGASVLCTPEYMAPEQAGGGGADPRSDLYAVGVMLFEMLAGRVPYVAADSAELLRRKQQAEAPRLREAAPGLDAPSELHTLVASCLARDPEQRPATAVAVAAALQRATHSLTPRREVGKSTIAMGSGSTDALLAPLDAARDRRIGWRPPQVAAPPKPAPDRRGGVRPVFPPGVTVPQRAPVANKVSVIRVHPAGSDRASSASSPAARPPPKPRPAPLRDPTRARASRAHGARPGAPGLLSVAVAMFAAALTAGLVTYGVFTVVPPRHKPAIDPTPVAVDGDSASPRAIGQEAPPATASAGVAAPQRNAPAAGHRSDVAVAAPVDRAPALARSTSSVAVDPVRQPVRSPKTPSSTARHRPTEPISGPVSASPASGSVPHAAAAPTPAASPDPAHAEPPATSTTTAPDASATAPRVRAPHTSPYDLKDPFSGN